jgi:hypothetical protein
VLTAETKPTAIDLLKYVTALVQIRNNESGCFLRFPIGSSEYCDFQVVTVDACFALSSETGPDGFVGIGNGFTPSAKYTYWLAFSSSPNGI